jgi:hypothetical protein
MNGALVAIALTFLFALFGSTHAQSMHVGVRCQDSFQDSWAPDIDIYPACSDFISQISSTDTVDFYFNLENAAPAFESGNANEACNSCGGTDSVDFFFMITHGTIANNNANYAGYAMWNDNSIAWTPTMRFGDSGKGLRHLLVRHLQDFRRSLLEPLANRIRWRPEDWRRRTRPALCGQFDDRRHRLCREYAKRAIHRRVVA